ncbi:MAG TPA: hypothetical protein VIQ24_22095 [Pyrinomonadaceae bacterium]
MIFELQDLPGRDDPRSLWELTYQWRIADGRAFSEWVSTGMDSTKESQVGILISKQSFTRRDLSKAENRQFKITVPVAGELFERLSESTQRNQAIWVDATVHIYDAKLNRQIIERVNPAWRWPGFKDGSARVVMQITPLGSWSWTSARPSANKNQPTETKTVTLPPRP